MPGRGDESEDLMFRLELSFVDVNRVGRARIVPKSQLTAVNQYLTRGKSFAKVQVHWAVATAIMPSVRGQELHQVRRRDKIHFCGYGRMLSLSRRGIYMEQQDRSSQTR
ncbi:uncharacterized protein MYCFIDRAFT_169375 [Pseudocercospora fijiensis CIRAD86]|uniref:Uncharacterized protein n=1 Tax=Pseudocercospora fijiensis (strain CIRAD86) TaxID=383855 RepID=N1Q9K1_PSEFD|nr:uncharacterized protein MYCFIDRAFT_169375 [Pseudocercospora fijiensis CIRAD86]EME87568.1 hypothetical protein MYCFIDRAFT_169375 [Pseudocercospora fijiensis CIRAD86]